MSRSPEGPSSPATAGQLHRLNSFPGLLRKALAEGQQVTRENAWRVLDHGARMKAVELWLEQGFGRPGTGAALQSAASIGSRQTLEELEALTTDELAAYVWALESDNERARRRRLIDEVAATEWPAGFAEALERLEQLSSDRLAGQEMT